MSTTRFHSRPLPAELDVALRLRLAAAHRVEPLSAVDARETVRRVASVAADLGLSAIVYRGGLNLRGSEVDHMWLDLDGYVIDAAFPLFVEGFIEVLRRYVAGDAEPHEVAAAAVDAGVEDRVLGRFPATAGYIGRPIWGQRGPVHS